MRLCWPMRRRSPLLPPLTHLSNRLPLRPGKMHTGKQSICTKQVHLFLKGSRMFFSVKNMLIQFTMNSLRHFKSPITSVIFDTDCFFFLPQEQHQTKTGVVWLQSTTGSSSPAPHTSLSSGKEGHRDIHSPAASFMDPSISYHTQLNTHLHIYLFKHPFSCSCTQTSSPCHAFTHPSSQGRAECIVIYYSFFLHLPALSALRKAC